MARFYLLVAAAILLPFAAALPRGSTTSRPYTIVQTNDDGWADSNIRELWKSLTAAGFHSIISAPADDRTGKGTEDHGPWAVDGGCHHDSCPHHSPPTGKNASQPRFNYVGGTPVAAMKYGVEVLAPKWFGGKPDIAVSGPNQSRNTGHVVGSGTLGAALRAAGEMGIPAIAFSGMTEKKTAWNDPVPLHSRVYADLATHITQAVLDSGPPYLPANTFLNVNFPEVRVEACWAVSDFKYVLTRLHHKSHRDVETCGSDRLPDDDVIEKEGCYVSISVVKADTDHIGTEAEREQQADVLRRLWDIFSCAPEN